MPTDSNMMCVGDVCDLQMGMTVRGRLEALEHGFLAIQLRDIDSSGAINWKTVARIRTEDVRNRYLVGPGDIVFRSRGERTTAAVVSPSLSEPAMAVAPLLILRPKTKFISASYLAWVINQAPVQRQFDEEAQGTNLRMVSKTTLEKAAIAVPDHATQQRILEIDALTERERDLSQQLTAKQYDLMHRLLTDRAAQAMQHRAAERISK
jgi:restriction endonuclease S subunit